MLLFLAPALAQGLDAAAVAARSGDYVAAFEILRPLAEQGDAEASFNLGVMYANGLGVTQNDTEAVHWYWLAATQGNSAAQNNLGLMYFEGRGQLQDYVMAHMWFNIAGANGLSNAISGRDAVELRAPPSQIADAQARARVCLATDYQHCE